MKKRDISIVIFIACILIGFLFSSNLSISESINFLDSKDYAKAYNEKQSLLNDVDNLYRQYKEIEDKIDVYKRVGDDDPKAKEDIQNEYYKYQGMAGLADIAGPGVAISINDMEGSNESTDLKVFDLVHNTDVLGIINDLKILGAEAIAVNGYRVVDTSEVICKGAGIMVNGINSPAPFIIEAIGDVSKLSTITSTTYTYGKIKSLRPQIQLTMEQKGDISIRALDFGRKVKGKQIK